MSARAFDEGFDAGVLASLAVLRHFDGCASTAYIEVVKACGPISDLIAAAKRDGQTEELRELRKLQREQKARRSVSRPSESGDTGGAR